MKHLSNIDLSQNQLLNGVIHNSATEPVGGIKGQVYFNTATNRLYVFNGTDWVGADAIDAMQTGSSIVTAINSSASIIELDNLPTGVATAVTNSHSATHAISQVTGLQTALDGKVDDSQVLTNVPVGATFTDTITTINGKTGAIAKADIVALGIPASDTNTTYANATTSVAGLMSTTDKTKLDGVATGANNYALPVAGAAIGGVKTGTDITVDASGNVSVTDNSHNHTSANISDATNLNTASMVVKRDVSGNFAAGTITAALAGNATTATTATTTTGNAGTATKLATARTIALTGDVTATGVAFDGSGNISLTTVITDDSHSHVVSNVDGLQGALDAKVDDAQLGVANGVATLDASGLVPSSQLPSFVDDVLEFANFAALPVTGEAGKIYVTLDTNITYRWSGTVYAEISKSLALGTVAGTAYAGDAGATLSSTLSSHTGNISNPHGVTKSQVGLGSADNTADSAKNVLSATKLTTARTIALTGDVTATGVSFDGSGNISLTTVVTDGSHNHTLANVTDVTSTATELNKLDGATVSTTELNYVTGVTSAIQTQLNARTRKYSASIGDGVATSIVVTHNLNTQDLAVTLREVATPYAMVITDIEFTTVNTITVKFASAPTTGQYRVTVVG